MKCDQIIPFHSFEFDPGTMAAQHRTFVLACTATPDIVAETGRPAPHIHTVIHPGTGEVHYFPAAGVQPPKDWS